MMKCRIAIMALLGVWLWPVQVFAQPAVFFDDFDGDALLPHWYEPPASEWEHNLSDSMLNVTGLFSPSHPKSPANFVTLGAYGAFATQTDFQLAARLGWDTSDTILRFDLTIMINQGLVATIGYRGASGIIAGTDAGVVYAPAPESGMYDFRMTRVGSVFNFYFDGSLFATLPSAYTGPVNGLQFFFASPHPGQSGPFHVDWVQVGAIPAPGTLFVFAAGLVTIPRRSRR